MSISLSGLGLAARVIYRQPLPAALAADLKTIADCARLSYPTSPVLTGIPDALVPGSTLGLPPFQDAKAIAGLNAHFQADLNRLTNPKPLEFDVKPYLHDVEELNKAIYLLDTNKALEAASKALVPFLNPTQDFAYIGVKKTGRALVPAFNDYKQALTKYTWHVGAAYATYDFKKGAVKPGTDAPLQEIASLIAKAVAQNLSTTESKNRMKAYLMGLINNTLLGSTVDSRVTQTAERISLAVAHFFELISQELIKQDSKSIPELFPELKDEVVAEPIQLLKTKASSPVQTLEDALFATALGVTVSGKLAQALLGRQIDPIPLMEKTLKANGFTLEQFNSRITELKNKGLLVSKDPINQVAAFLTEKGVFTAPPLNEHVQPARLFPNGKIDTMFEATVDSNGHIKISAKLLALLKSDAFKSEGDYQLNYVKTEAGKVLVFPNLWSNPNDPLDPDNLLSHDSVALAARAAGDLIVDENGNALIITSRSAHFCSEDTERAEDCAKSEFPATPFKDIHWATTKAYQKSAKVLTAAEFAALQSAVAVELAAK